MYQCFVLRRLQPDYFYNFDDKINKMKLSIITITYNAEQFLEQTIQSILAQTDQDFEYIIVDGKSRSEERRVGKEC